MYSTIAALFDEGVSTYLEKGEVLFRSGAPVKFMFLVKSGGVELIRHTQSGDRLVLSRMTQGSVLAEASAYSKTYHCDGVSIGPSHVKRIQTATFVESLARDKDLVNGGVRTCHWGGAKVDHFGARALERVALI
jgi:CRP-like cAMP-binding protein